MKKMYVNGDSWTVGTAIEQDPIFIKEIKKQGSDEYGRLVQHYTWSGQLSKMFNAECINQAQAGGSNHRIVRTTCEYIQSIPKEEHKDLFVVIGWTSCDRQELHINDRYYVYNPAFTFSCDKLRDGIPFDILYDIDRYQKIYITHLFDEYPLLVTYYQQKYLLANYLENLGIKYYFFDAIHNVWDKNKCVHNDYCDSKEKMLSEYNVKFKPTMIDFCKEFDIITPCFHTLTSGHNKWANILYKDILRIYPELEQ
jgi:hypothetical protein